MAKRKAFYILKFILILFVIFLLLIGFLPTLLSTQLGNQAIIKATEKFTKNTISFSELSLSWIGPQKVENFYMKDSKGKKVFSFAALTSDWHPFLIISSKKSFGKTTLKTPMLYLVIDENASNRNESSTPKGKSKQRASSPKSPTGTPFKIPYSLDLDILNGSVFVKSDAAGEADFINLNLDFTAKEKSNSLSFNLSGDTEKGSQKGKIEITSKFQFTDKKTSVDKQFSNVNITANCKIKKLPVPALEEIIFMSQPSKKGILEALLGPSLNTTIALKANGEDSNVDIDISSENLTGKIVAESLDGILKLSKPGSISLNIDDSFLKIFSGDLKLSLPYKYPLILSINELQGPIKALQSKASLMKEFGLDATLKIPNLQVADLPVVDQIQGEKIVFHLKGSSLNNLQLTGEASLASYASDIKNYIGSTVALKIEGNPNLEKDFTVNDFNFLLRSEKLSMSTSGSFAKKAFTLSKAINCTYVLSPEILASLSIPHIPKLKTPLSFRATLTSNPIELDSPPWENLAKLKISGNASIDKASFKSPHTESFELNEATVDFEINNSANNAQIVFKSQLERESINDMMGLDGKITLTNYLAGNKISFSKARGFFYFNMPDLPTQLVGSYFDEGELFELLFGPTLNLSFNTSLQHLNENQGRLKLKAQSDTLDAYLECQIGKALTLYQSPAYIKWTISPKAFSSLYRLRNVPSDSLLLKEASIEFNIDQLSWPMHWEREKGSEILNIAEISADLKLKSPQFIFGDLDSGQDAVLHDLQIDIGTKKLSEELVFSMTASSKIKSGDSEEKPVKGNIRLEGNLKEPLSLDEFKISKLNLSINGKLTKFPTEGFTPIYFFSPKLDQLLDSALGSEMNAGFSTTLNNGQGPFKVDITSLNGRFSLDGRFADGSIYLTKDMAASLTLTPAVLKSLAMIHPFLKDVISAPQPIQLKIAADKTQIPLMPWNPKDLNLGSSKLDLGKIKISSKGDILHLLSLLNYSPESKDIDAWFSALRFDVNQGLLTCKRTDTLLAQTIHFATWGNIDLSTEKINMLLAITPGTLSRTLGANHIGDDVYLQIPIKGTMGSINADWSKAATELTGMGIQKIFRNPLGDLLGAAVSKVGSLQNEKVPPAPPLPWTENDIKTKSDRKQKKASPSSSFQKDAKKSIESLFDLFE